MIYKHTSIRKMCHITKSMQTPEDHTHLRFFPKLLPHNWKHTIVYNVLVCCNMTRSLYWNIEAQNLLELRVKEHEWPAQRS